MRSRSWLGDCQSFQLIELRRLRQRARVVDSAITCRKQCRHQVESADYAGGCVEAVMLGVVIPADTMSACASGAMVLLVV